MDELEYIKKLAGVNEFKGYSEYTLENISDAANSNAQKMRDQNIKPGDEEWFKLWFAQPGLTGENPMPKGHDLDEDAVDDVKKVKNDIDKESK